MALDDDLVIEADSADVLGRLPDGAFDLIYIDPPFNTGRTAGAPAPAHGRAPTTAATAPASAAGATARGCCRRSPTTTSFDDYLGFLEPRLGEARASCSPRTARCTSTSTTARRTTARCCSTSIFGRECFLNEIIWAYDYGARSQAPLAGQARHDPRLRQGPRRATGSTPTAVEREPYMAPGLVERRRRPRAASCRPTCGGTRSCRPTGARRPATRRRSPRASLRRIVAASSRPGGWCLDFFAGSGTLGAVCAGLDRRFVLVDSAPEASRRDARSDSRDRRTPKPTIRSRHEALRLLRHVHEDSAPGRPSVRQRQSRAARGRPRPGGRQVLRARRRCRTSSTRRAGARRSSA